MCYLYRGVFQISVTIANDIEYTDTYLALNKNVTPAVWLAEGSNDCSFVDWNRTAKAVALRQTTTGLAKVARWTIDSQDHIRKALR